MHHLAFAFICLVWGGSFLLMKKASLAFGPITVATGRVLGGACILALVCRWRGSERPLQARHLPLLGFIVLIGYVWPYAIQPWLVSRHGGALIGTTVSLVPLATILVSIPILAQLPTMRQTLGVLGGCCCLQLLVADGWQRQVPIPDLLMALSVPVAYALCNTIIKRYLTEVAPLPLSVGALAFSALLLAPMTATETMHFQEDLPLALAAIAILGIVGTGIANFLFNYLIHERGPLFASMVTYLVPVGALLWGWLDNETVTLLQVIALVGIFAMVALVQTQPTPPLLPPDNQVDGE